MPVARFGGGERPLHRVPVQTGLDLYIIGHIYAVIVIDEGMAANRVVQRNRRNHEYKSERPGVLRDSTHRTWMGLHRHLWGQANRSQSFSLYSRIISRQFWARWSYRPRWIFSTSLRHSRSCAVSPSAR